MWNFNIEIMELKQCYSCGHGAYSVYELKNGLCPGCYEDYLENEPCTSCPRCGRSYDDIGYDYQFCSKCGWDEDTKKYDLKLIRVPSEGDYMSGDADILTGRWL